MYYVVCSLDAALTTGLGLYTVSRHSSRKGKQGQGSRLKLATSHDGRISATSCRICARERRPSDVLPCILSLSVTYHRPSDSKQLSFRHVALGQEEGWGQGFRESTAGTGADAGIDGRICCIQRCPYRKQ